MLRSDLGGLFWQKHHPNAISQLGSDMTPDSTADTEVSLRSLCTAKGTKTCQSTWQVSEWNLTCSNSSTQLQHLIGCAVLRLQHL